MDTLLQDLRRAAHRSDHVPRIAALMCAVTFVASYLPARRAARVDPMIALRAE